MPCCCGVEDGVEEKNHPTKWGILIKNLKKGHLHRDNKCLNYLIKYHFESHDCVVHSVCVHRDKQKRCKSGQKNCKSRGQAFVFFKDEGSMRKEQIYGNAPELAHKGNTLTIKCMQDCLPFDQQI